MQNEGFQPNAYTIVSLLKACGDILDIKNGMELHSQASMKGLDEHDFVASALLTMYGKCGNLEEAEQVFNRLPKHNIVLWNAMLCAYGDRVEGEKIWLLYERMEAEGIEPNERTFVSLIQACCMLAEREEGAMVQGKLLKEKSLAAGRQLHACVSTKGLMTNVIICNILISMFGKCGSIADAESIFWKMSNHTVVSWTAMVTAYIEQDYPEIALQIFAHLQRGNVSPNEWTYTNAIQACCCLVEEEELFSVKCWRTRELPLVIARSLHADARKRGYDVDLSVGSMLINLYGKCGSCHEGVHLFNTLPKRSVGLWNVLLSAYIEQGAGDTVLHLYRLMQEEGVLPDEQTSVIALQACSLLAIEEEPAYMLGRKIKKVSLDIGRAIHTDAQMMGFDRDVFFGSMLVSMYGKCGSVVDAENVFEGLVNCDVVAWTAMLSCYGEQGLAQSASDLYQKMQVKGVIIDSGALISLLQACRDTGTFELCKQVHFDIVAAEEDDLLLTTALVHAYSYCSSMVDARAVFNTLLEPDLVSWNSLITGHTKLGSYALSFETFDCMKREGIKPNEVTFLTLLSTCGHAGLVSKGIELFESMSKEYGLIPKIDHFGTLVDLLGRTGNLKTAEDMLLRLPGEPDLAMWLCLLDACQKHGNLILGEHVFNQAVLLYPDSASAYVMMSNMYANEGLWESARLVDQIGHKRCILN
ncbi:hypothetical protein KP509_35G011900 [Ceratopteris richardii]|nr:hypothetical protein KP509_35G011900 [Ceratopteris richardii]